ncbi:hypothetical protein [Methanosarcina mazei]|nr:hypothetical protein [Methanosarcina mazei]
MKNSSLPEIGGIFSTRLEGLDATSLFPGLPPEPFPTVIAKIITRILKR